MAAKSLVLCTRSAQISSLFVAGACGSRSLLPASFTCVQQVRHRRFPDFHIRPSIRKPWHVRKWTTKDDDGLCASNEAFVKQVIIDKYTNMAQVESPLRDGPWERNPYVKGTRRTGVLALKLGVMVQYTKDGQSFLVTLLQVLDNHVINYVPPEVYATYPSHKPYHDEKFGLQIVGALSCDPRQFSKPYNNLFVKAGVPPKRWLTRFLVTPDAAVQPETEDDDKGEEGKGGVSSFKRADIENNHRHYEGTPLSVKHFRVGEYVDVQSRTRDYGFQGVIKRWGMKGMPKSHGVTKSHRKMGSTGGGGAKGGIWKGKKMPGILGNRLRELHGLKIWRINTKYNILYITGNAVPGLPHTFVRVCDTRLHLRRIKEELHDNVPMPTWFPEDETDPLPEELFDEQLFQFTDPSIEVTP